jgi:DNA-binding Xre family transcriptional regulator
MDFYSVFSYFNIDDFILKRLENSHMLKYNLERILHQKGITAPVAFLIKAGFKKTTAGRFARGKFTEISMSNLEKLCLLFRCTPNDLLEWTPARQKDRDDNQPLEKLLSSSTPSFDLRHIGGDIPYDKLSDFAEKILAVKKELLEKK